MKSSFQTPVPQEREKEKKARKKEGRKEEKKERKKESTLYAYREI
jgi:hypothetical protein